MTKQAEEACERVKSHKLFGENEFNVVGLSQGGLIARYIAESCETKHPVRNLVTVGTPNNGVDYEEGCGEDIAKLKQAAEEAEKRLNEEAEKAKQQASNVKE